MTDKKYDEHGNPEFNEKTDCGMCATTRTPENTDEGMNICKNCVESCF